MHSLRTMIGLLVPMLTACLLAVAAVVVCPRCGWEQPEGATNCSHCGAALVVKVQAAKAAEPVRARDATFIGAAALDWEMARQHAGQGHAWLAWYFARNAQALLAVGGDEPKAGEGPGGANGGAGLSATNIVSLLQSMEKRIRMSSQACPACEGTGQRVFTFSTAGGRTHTYRAENPVCAVCGGSGMLAAFKTADALTVEKSQAQRDYEAYQHDRGWVQAGAAWLPATLAQGLKLRDRVAIYRALGNPCDACSGQGMVACAKCNGMGVIKCTAKDCREGTVLCPDCDGEGKVVEESSSSSKNHKSKKKNMAEVPDVMADTCKTCDGKGRVFCTTCQGRGVLDCPACLGKMAAICKKCNGTGQTPVCSRCRGEGLLPCGRCKGTGKYHNEICTECQGEGVVLCTVCGGTGHTPQR